MIITETRTVYRAKGAPRSRFTRQAAYHDAAKLAWRAAHPCECEAADHSVGDSGYTCEWHTDEGRLRGAAVIDRLARLWMRRDRKAVSK